MKTRQPSKKAIKAVTVKPEDLPYKWDIERYFPRPLPSFTMLDVLGTLGEKPVTRLETELRDFNGYLPMYPYAEYFDRLVKARLMPSHLLEQACAGDASSIAKINMLAPGLIYTNKHISGWLISHTQKCVQCADATDAKKSQDWLREALKVDRPSVTDHEIRPIINLAHAEVFGPLYIDVVALRTAYTSLRAHCDTSDEGTLMPELRKYFPHLPETDPFLKYVRMAAGVGRYQRAQAPSDKTVRPLDVACDVLGHVSRFSRDLIRKQVIPCIPDWDYWSGECARRGKKKSSLALSGIL